MSGGDKSVIISLNTTSTGAGESMTLNHGSTNFGVQVNIPSAYTNVTWFLEGRIGGIGGWAGAPNSTTLQTSTSQIVDVKVGVPITNARLVVKSITDGTTDPIVGPIAAHL